MDAFAGLPFVPTEILLPQECELEKWSVVACDQYTSQSEYWERVGETVGRAPSSLRLILPESSLNGPDMETDILEINQTMARYLRDGRFRLLPDALIYVERTLHSGKVRRGLVGALDLEAYDYEPGSSSLIRATEGTVLSRIPPRVAVRKNAPIELPHVMVLTDDPGRTVIEPLAAAKDSMEKLYDFRLMERGGRVAGYLVPPEEQARIAGALRALRTERELLFAVGDGNHSLATAKECYEHQKTLTASERWPELPARYALVELVNLHDDALEFEPIHRVLFGVDAREVLEDLRRFYPGTTDAPGQGHVLRYVYADGTGTLTVPDPPSRLPVGTLQTFLDDYVRRKNCRIDYVHGTDTLLTLASRPGCLGFLLGAMDKSELFPTVIRDGVLPRKTFSMGEANDKRYYLEARKIR